MRFHLDEHIPSSVADGLRRRGIDVTTTLQAGLSGAMDRAHLVYARESSRVILTQDEDFLAMAAAGMEHSGIVFCSQGARTVGQIIEFLLLLDGCLSETEMRNHIEFVAR
jgi:predicted nuclease of predicted toxin-antitoxin system